MDEMRAHFPRPTYTVMEKYLGRATLYEYYYGKQATYE
jgi:hypothetical protein